MEIESGNGRFISELQGARYSRSETRQQAAGHQAIFGIFTNRGLVVLPFACKELVGHRLNNAPLPPPQIPPVNVFRQLLASVRSRVQIMKTSRLRDEGVNPARLRLLEES